MKIQTIGNLANIFGLMLIIISGCFDFLKDDVILIECSIALANRVTNKKLYIYIYIFGKCRFWEIWWAYLNCGSWLVDALKFNWFGWMH